MSKTAMEWLRASAQTVNAQRESVMMNSEPVSCERSPCCKLMLIKIPIGSNEAEHYRCAECGELYVWSGSEWVLCELQDKHRAQSRETVRR